MELDDLKQNWETFGRDDPLWAVRTNEKNWDEDAFFESGEVEIDELLNLLTERGLPFSTGRALDFGCGVGRLSQGLSQRFDRVDGVDIAVSMKETAEAYRDSRRPGSEESIRFWVNSKDDLTLFEDSSFDLVYSNIVLQHMKPAFAKKYISEFGRILKPGGVVAFQLPTHRTTAMLRLRGATGRNLRRFRSKLQPGRSPVMEMYGIEQPEVEAAIGAAGLTYVGRERNEAAGPTWESFLFLSTRPA